MRKYLAVAKILFKAQIIYRFDVAMTAVATIWRVLFAWILWGAVFSGRETVGGFTFQAMLSYYVVSSFLSSVEMSDGISGEVSGRIRGGTFSKYMVIPTTPQLHFLSQSFGVSGYYAIFSVMAAIFCTLVFRIKLSFAANPMAIMCAIVMILMGIIFMVSYQFFIGILTFKFQDMGFFKHIQGVVISFFTGTIVPLSLLSEATMNILCFLPFTYVTYMPAMLLTGQTEVVEGIFGLAVLSVWTVAMLIASQLTYKRLRVKFDGVGI